MIDTGIFLDYIDQNKEIKKRNNKIIKTSPISHLNNNRLYGLCSKFNNANNSYSINNNLVIGNINNINNINYKTINDSSHSNYDLNNNNKVFGYKENIKIKQFKKINNQNKVKSKYNNMKNGEIYLKAKQKETKKIIDINNINSFNDSKLENSRYNHFNTISVENFHSAHERNKISIIKK